MIRSGILIGCVVLLCGIGALQSPMHAHAQDEPVKNAAKSAPPPIDDPAANPPAHPDGDARHMPRRGPDGEPHMRGPGDDADPPGPPEGRPWRESGVRGPFSTEMVERLMNVVRDLDADRASRLEALRESDPKRFAQVLGRSARHLLGLSLLKDRDPDLYEMKLAELRVGEQIDRIAQEIRAARDTCSETEMTRLTGMLRERLREQSDLNFRARGRELVLLDDHLKTMREKLVDDINRRDDLIEQRLTDLLNQTGNGDDDDAFAVEDPQN